MIMLCCTVQYSVWYCYCFCGRCLPIQHHHNHRHLTHVYKMCSFLAFFLVQDKLNFIMTNTMCVSFGSMRWERVCLCVQRMSSYRFAFYIFVCLFTCSLFALMPYTTWYGLKQSKLNEKWGHEKMCGSLLVCLHSLSELDEKATKYYFSISQMPNYIQAFYASHKRHAIRTHRSHVISIFSSVSFLFSASLFRFQKSRHENCEKFLILWQNC